jgi:pyroglutamyl-peptidase
MASPRASGSGAGRFRSPAFSAPVPAGGAVSDRVLLTGFGPFPGIKRNASARLARELARLGAVRHSHLRFVAEVLPVNWSAAPLRLADLLRHHRPAVALHFGVSPRARGFVIETLAFNAAKDLPDDSGKIAADFVLVPGDRRQRSATLPVRRILNSLHDAGYPAQISADPGRYLCNAVLFHSLRHAARSVPRTRTGFVHVPATLEADVPGEPAAIGWPEALEGGLRLVDECVTPLRPRESILS